ncbi:hypothetical protein [Kamptonema formosum]|uniref:hypothetical protein n=1 Tax=Kamptonema formosum TaxID=331992 RepID=UPI00034610C3|nr:hypothetical protein [Oscillatoria sp. PCC 10802]
MQFLPKFLSHTTGTLRTGCRRAGGAKAQLQTLLYCGGVGRAKAQLRTLLYCGGAGGAKAQLQTLLYCVSRWG